MFRDGALSLDQLKVRVNLKHKRANYKCLDDLIAEGLDPKVKKNAARTAEYLRTIHGKQALGEIETEAIFKREPWQGNNHCLKSLFYKPGTQGVVEEKKYKELTSTEIEEYAR